MTSPSDPTDLLTEAIDGSGDGFVELRYHKKRTRLVAVEKGRVDQAKISEHTGVGVRVLQDGTWGFASTDRLEGAGVRKAIDSARSAARSSAAIKKDKVQAPPATDLARGRFEAAGYDELENRPLEESLELVLKLEAETRAASSSIQSASCAYTEIFEEKGIVTTDGAKAWTRLVRPEFRMMAVAQDAGEIQRGARSVGAW